MLLSVESPCVTIGLRRCRHVSEQERFLHRRRRLKRPVKRMSGGVLLQRRTVEIHNCFSRMAGCMFPSELPSFVGKLGLSRQNKWNAYTDSSKTPGTPFACGVSGGWNNGLYLQGERRNRPYTVLCFHYRRAKSEKQRMKHPHVIQYFIIHFVVYG